MGSIGTRRFAGSLAAALVVSLLAPFVPPPSAGAQPAPLPPVLPDGYSMLREGEVRWVYPTSAEAERARLGRAQRRGWAELGHAFGLPLPGELDVRLAVNPEQMQAVAPPGRELPDYATGVAYPQDGLILLSMTEPESWLRSDVERVLVHELAHVALHRAVSGQPVPRWFSEGVAIHAAGEHSIARVRVLWEATLRGRLIPLDQLSQRFPARHGEVSVAYAQSADLVGHLLQDDHGRRRFRKLIAELRDGTPFEAAFAASYDMPLWRLEQQWRALLTQRYGSWPSILGGLTVVWAVAALLLVIGYVRVRRRHRNTLKRWAIEEAPVLALEGAQATPENARSVADEVLDAWSEQQRKESGVPTIVHEGRAYTLH